MKYLRKKSVLIWYDNLQYYLRFELHLFIVYDRDIAIPILSYHLRQFGCVLRWRKEGGLRKSYRLDNLIIKMIMVNCMHQESIKHQLGLWSVNHYKPGCSWHTTCILCVLFGCNNRSVNWDWEDHKRKENKISVFFKSFSGGKCCYFLSSC